MQLPLRSKLKYVTTTDLHVSLFSGYFCNCEIFTSWKWEKHSTKTTFFFPEKKIHSFSPPLFGLCVSISKVHPKTSPSAETKSSSVCPTVDGLRDRWCLSHATHKSRHRGEPFAVGRGSCPVLIPDTRQTINDRVPTIYQGRWNFPRIEGFPESEGWIGKGLRGTVVERKMKKLFAK